MSWHCHATIKVELKTYAIQFSAGHPWPSGEYFLALPVAPFHAGVSPLGDSPSRSLTWFPFRGVEVLPLRLLVSGSWSVTDTEPTHSLFCIVVPHALCPCTSLVLLVTYSDKYIWGQLSGLVSIIKWIHNDKNDRRMKRMNTYKTIISGEEKIKFEQQLPSRLDSNIIDWQHILFIKNRRPWLFRELLQKYFILHISNKKISGFSVTSFYIVLSYVQPKHGSLFSSVIRLLVHNVLQVIMRLTWFIFISQRDNRKKEK